MWLAFILGYSFSFYLGVNMPLLCFLHMQVEIFVGCIQLRLFIDERLFDPVEAFIRVGEANAFFAPRAVSPPSKPSTGNMPLWVWLKSDCGHPIHTHRCIRP